MSFSDEVKNEVAREEILKDCCQQAELAALIKVEGSLEIVGNRIGLKLLSQRALIARELYKLLTEKYDFIAEIRVGQRRSFGKGKYYIINIPPQAEIKKLLLDCGLVDSNYVLGSRIKDDFMQKRCCRKAYLKGLFLAAGMITDPNSDYHLEFFIKYKEYAENLLPLFDKLSIDAKVRARNEKYSIYLKKADDIIKILNLIGAKTAQLKFENIRILKDLKNNVNRKVNLETANLSRTALAAQKQLEDIEIIDQVKGLDNISGSLQEIAYYRRKNPYSSLKELGEIIGLSKSGVNHRLRRIKKIAQNIRSGLKTN